MAKQTNRESTQQQSNLQSSSSSNDVEPQRARRSLRLLSPSTPRPEESIPPRAAVRPAAHPPICKGILLLLLDKDDQALPSTPSTATTPRTKSFSARKLLTKSSSKRQMNAPTATSFKFKKQYCVLHGANGLYQIRYGDSYDGPVAGVHEFLTAGVSSIEHTSRSSSQSFGFEIMINPNDLDAPSLCCAADSEEDFMMWMSSLTSVIDGSLNTTTENIDEQGTSTE